MDRRSLVVDVLRLWIRPDEPVKIVRLELVRVGSQRFAIGDAEVRDAGREIVVENQGTQCRVAAGTATWNGQSARVHLALSGKILRGADAVLSIYEPPRTLQPLAIRRPVT